MSSREVRSAAYEWGFEKGELAERERIIKLLEDPANHRNDVDPDWYTGIADAIALIKGETSE